MLPWNQGADREWSLAVLLWPPLRGLLIPSEGEKDHSPGHLVLIIFKTVLIPYCQNSRQLP